MRENLSHREPRATSRDREAACGPSVAAGGLQVTRARVEIQTSFQAADDEVLILSRVA